jgi:nucleoside-diphosphate-sugar epimerase
MNLGTDTVLVTGAAGWLGRGLLRALTQGLADVPALSVPDPRVVIRALLLPGEPAEALPGKGGGVSVVRGDLRNPADCARFCAGARGAVIFHLAGVIHPRRSVEFDAVNVGGTENLLHAAQQAGVRRCVVMSSNSPLGVNPHPDHRFDESSPYRPYMGYGRSKMRMELAARAAQSAGGLQTVIVRAPWFYGPFQPPRQSEFFRMVRDGKGPLVGGGHNRRSMAYIDNLCQGLLLAAAHERANGQIYWIADERPYPMTEIIDTVERLLEREFGIPCAHRRLRLPGLASEAAMVVDWTLQALGFYHPKIHVLSEMNKTIACDISKAKEELGYRPTVALEEGMRRSIAWALAQGQL